MALKEPLMVKKVSLSSATSTTPLTAGIGESYKIKDIRLSASPTGSLGSPVFATFKIDRTTVGFWRIDSTYGSHLAYPLPSHLKPSLFSYLVKNNIFPPIPVVSGESFIIEFSSAYTGYVEIVYEVYDAQDVNNTAPNGSKSSEFYYINYGTNSSNLTADGYYEINTCLNPAEFPDFPFGDKVPPETRIEILGCLAQDLGYKDGSNNTIQTKTLRFVRGMTELFDTDKTGFYLEGSIPTSAGNNLGAGISYFDSGKVTSSKPIVFFEPPLVFNAGEEFKIYVYVDISGTISTGAKFLDVPLIMHLTKTTR